MNIRLIEVVSADDFHQPELSERFRVSTKSSKTVSYRALRDKCEVAFVALDRWPELDRLVLYELFVPVSLREKGVGSATLQAVEELAVSEGFAVVRLLPRPLDPSVDHDRLQRGYRHRGYRTTSDGTGELEKHLRTT